MISIIENRGPQTRFLRADLLLPGDVLLVLRPESESHLIARWTRGPYSHAAIYHGALCIFEAAGAGVGYTGLEIAGSCPSVAERACVLLDVSHFERIEIRRHPHLEKLASDSSGRYDLEDDLARLLVPENGKQYPPLEALARAVPGIPWPLVLPILKWKARTEAIDSLVPGMFCSQLVVSVLRELGAEPMKQGRFRRLPAPETVSPNHLQSRRSALRRVPEVIVDAAFGGANSTERDLEPMRAMQRSFLEQVDRNLNLTTRLAVRKIDQLHRRLENKQ